MGKRLVAIIGAIAIGLSAAGLSLHFRSPKQSYSLDLDVDGDGKKERVIAENGVKRFFGQRRNYWELYVERDGRRIDLDEAYLDDQVRGLSQIPNPPSTKEGVSVCVKIRRPDILARLGPYKLYSSHRFGRCLFIPPKGKAFFLGLEDEYLKNKRDF